MPTLKFLGTDKYQKTWYFEQPQTGGATLIVDPQGRVYWEPELHKVYRPVAQLEVNYADGKVLMCPLDAEHAMMVVDRTKNNTLRTHFFMYRGFVFSVPFTYQVHSRYKKYQGLRGTIE